MTLGLTGLIAPVPTDEFFASYYHRSPLYVPGGEDRFARLLTWEEINSALSGARLEFPRLRLVCAGTALEPEQYTERLSVGEGRTAPRVLTAPLTSLLRQGATMIIDAVDEFCDPLSDVAADLERRLRLQVGACAYTSMTTEPAFETHIDQVDTFVIQRYGAKRWRIYEPTREAPLLRDVAAEVVPAETLVLDQVLTPGDVLYFPRGWWHSVETVEPPALHVTLGVAAVCGSHLLEWVAEQLLNDPRFRRDVPIHEGEAAKAAYMDGLAQAITGLWGPGLLDSFLGYRDLQARARQRFGLPATGLPGLLPPGDDFSVRFTVPRASVKRKAGEVTVFADGRRWTFDEVAAGLLEVLASGKESTFEKLCAESAHAIDPKEVRSLLEDFQAAGLLRVRLRS